ncbi:MAG TPA: toll/interleukin-1 receptor domain-containing protein, partial [Phototrophicaceae bacterium]|nr:toll/interleukin-1 receptor domain-containing protein [Phototrophicaceae bacterium]
MSNTLFISYSRKQHNQAIQLDNIKLKQFYWWMDYRIVATADWWNALCEAIEESYCVVALLSKNYVESVYCMGELQYALKINKPILSLMLEPN